MIRSLLDRGAVGLVTTHDLELTRIVQSLDGRAANYHFEDQITDGTMTFDYELRDGVVERSNAIELMRMMGLGRLKNQNIQVGNQTATVFENLVMRRDLRSVLSSRGIVRCRQPTDNVRHHVVTAH